MQLEFYTIYLRVNFGGIKSLSPLSGKGFLIRSAPAPPFFLHKSRSDPPVSVTKPLSCCLFGENKSVSITACV